MLQVIGLNNVPSAGDEFEAARERAEECAIKLRDARIFAKDGEGKVTLSSLANVVAQHNETGVERHQLNIVLKVDVQVCFICLPFIAYKTLAWIEV